MLKEFIDFVDSVLPNVPQNTKDAAKYAIDQFEKDGECIRYLTLSPLRELSQGDVISNIPFYYINRDGYSNTFVTDAMVISTSCHIDQRNKLVLAAVLPINGFIGNVEELKNNRIYNYMYIPTIGMEDKYICFDYMTSINKDLILENIKNGKIHRNASLNQIGYYLLIIKLTVNFMRKEDSGTLEERNNDFNYK
jgi:hypothetical protein